MYNVHENYFLFDFIHCNIISIMSIKNSNDDHQKNEIDIKFDRII